MIKKYAYLLLLIALTLQLGAVNGHPSYTTTPSFTTYFPIVMSPYRAEAYEPTCKRGLARAALEGWGESSYDDLGLCWFADWNTSMAVPYPKGKIPQIPCNYNRIRTTDPTPLYDYSNPLLPVAIRDLGHGYEGYLLVFNEPNEPWQQCGFGDLALRPQPELARDAAIMYLEIREAFPHAKLIIGNIYAMHEHDLLWFYYFRDEVVARLGYFPANTGYGIHTYATDLSAIQPIVLEMCNIIRHQLGGGQLWITEWGIDQRDAYAEWRVREIRQWFEQEPCVTRHAYYTNAQPWLRDGVAPFPPTDLFAPDSYTQLSPSGRGFTTD